MNGSRLAPEEVKLLGRECSEAVQRKDFTGKIQILMLSCPIPETYGKLRFSEADMPAQISAFFAECVEFPVLGKFHEDITLQEAVKYYNEIPFDRLHGIKSIGFKLEDGTIYDGTYNLFSREEILYEELDMVLHYCDSPFVIEMRKPYQAHIRLSTGYVNILKNSLGNERETMMYLLREAGDIYGSVCDNLLKFDFYFDLYGK